MLSKMQFAISFGDKCKAINRAIEPPPMLRIPGDSAQIAASWMADARLLRLADVHTMICVQTTSIPRKHVLWAGSHTQPTAFVR
jgi:hypothetical protein